MVELEFSIDKDDYKIVRGLSPKIFEIHRNGKLINQDSKNIDYQGVLEEQILKMNYINKQFKSNSLQLFYCSTILIVLS